MTKAEILKQCKSEGVRFMRLQFTDIHGANKNVEIPASQFPKALDGEIMFDGSSIEGFTRIEESDMLLVPDLDTFRVFPWKEDQGRVARIMCDVKQPDGSDFDGDPRNCLRRMAEKAKKKGYTMMVGPEVEFFLFQLDDEGGPSTRTHDVGAYFDLAPVDRGEDCRRDIVLAMEAMGFEVEAAHHEVAQGQHEIDFKYGDALATADNVATFRFLVRHIALDHGLHATFMPKPIFGQNGSGMHCHQSLFQGGKNAFFDPKKKPYQLSTIALHYIGGLLRHARGFLAITNPTVNSYKRLVPGYEAPTNVAWSERNRSPMIRIPAKRGTGTRCEVRVPDPSCNPYLAFAVMLAAGLDGIEKKIDPGEPVNKNVFTMSQREKSRLKIQELPSTLREALDAMEKDSVILDALGEHLSSSYLAGKRKHWNDFLASVHPWELEQYLAYY